MPKLVYLFRITLNSVDPSVWRVVRVPAEYTFWDLHVAIQDAMGWMDYHLHEFRHSEKTGGNGPRIGVPVQGEDDVLPGAALLAGWRVPLTKVFKAPGDLMYYLYDFGDHWDHEVLLEGVLLHEKGVKYPQCVGGARATPPEDCGGEPGYLALLETLASPKSAGYKEMADWLRHHVKNYWPFDPDAFDAGKVKFTSPARRLKKLMEG